MLIQPVLTGLDPELIDCGFFSWITKALDLISGRQSLSEYLSRATLVYRMPLTR